MCGIAGLVRRDGRPSDEQTIIRMTDAVAHRGPDGGHYMVEGTLALGHRRLSILDLSDLGRQPMSYSSGRFTITYNGEIYNYLELRTELKALGHIFSNDTDTEVLLAAYSEWGSQCVKRFNGMWSFALFDRIRNVLFCSRDRFGVKPFYYIDRPNIFAFGSEIRQLLPFLGKIRADLGVLHTYLVTDAAELSAETFFQDVRKLLGGHNLTYDFANGRITIERFYEIVKRSEVSSLPEGEAIEAFAALLQDAIRLRMRSDVKVGTCLSGGLDSSSVATIASELYRAKSSSKFSAITAVSEQASNNEASYAEQVVDASELDWYQTRPSYQDFADSLPQVVQTQEEPFGGPSITMQHFVMKAARANGIVVLLDGQGGDETLLGYEKYYAAYILATFRQGGPLAAMGAMRAVAANNSKMGPVNIAKYLIGGLVAPARYMFYRHRHSYVRNHGSIPAHIKAFARAGADDFALQELEIRSTNLPVLLRYEDKNSMAHGVETRLPFLDYRLLETSLSLPGTLKIRDGWTKWILRKTMDRRMPDTIVWRKNKFGFEAPEDMWLKAHAKEMKSSVLKSGLLSELVDTKKLATAYDSLDKRSRWRLYNTALWEKAFSVSSA
jgi:asparagine synthase (glutamine-hydrolysing)